ncbi:conserved hypothetical protein [Pediculus humanus corporis]|uniref:RING-type E3 ubiquitin transferase n=1 Tax=Pediculus humanus subsp. corporis TaxID=121224 RepID=E0VX95_PEDHC|nr:uncharacterized protein Phum_PHUM497580 [Pediculus humanus corporis]EEB18001.1 conserved hypothetical protein [Pediculus humanus corporis]
MERENGPPVSVGNPTSSRKALRQITSTVRKMSEEMLDTAEETIIDFITCPYCTDYIRPPSVCCESGHFVCRQCKTNISHCPTCGTDRYPNKSNSVFDMILREIYYPCLYQGNGCSAYFKHDQLQIHQNNCKFKMEPCVYQSEGCKVFTKGQDNKIKHETICDYGVRCKIYGEINNKIHVTCTWKGKRKDLLKHVSTSHQYEWSPHEIVSDVALSWILPLNINFEKIQLIHLKDFDEMFFFYSKTIENYQHFVGVQYVGHRESWKKFLYSVEFIYENKKVGFEDLVIPHTVKKTDDVYGANNCFSVHFEFLKKHFLAESVIDCHVRFSFR